MKIRRAAGFSLTEMLIATGIMAIGLVMVATIFPVGVKLTSLTTERTVGSIVADEAFAKVKLYGLRDFALWPEALIDAASGSPLPDSAEATYYAHSDFLYTLNGILEPDDGTGDGEYGTDDDVFTWPGANGNFGDGDDVTDSAGLFLSESQYPSGNLPAGEKYRYHWSALCRRVGLKDVQVTVFVTRKALGNLTYYNNPFDFSVPEYLMQDQAVWPTPIKVNVVYVSPRQLEIQAGLGDNGDLESLAAAGSELLFLSKLFDEGYTLVGDHNGAIGRILEMEDVDNSDGANIKEIINLYEDWQPSGNTEETVWVVPPGVGSNRYPCIGVYQKIIRFDDIN